MTNLFSGLEFLHHDVFWALTPAGIILMALGFTKSIAGASNVISKLKESEGHVQQIGQEAVTVLSKLNESEAELTDQNKRFHAALENMSQGLCMFDSDQRLIVCNELYATMYGLSNDLMIPGTTFRQILEHRIKNNVFMGDDSEKYIEERLAAVSEDEASKKIQLLSDGRVFAIGHRPLTDGGWVATHEDISELAKAETMNQRLASIVEDAVNEIYVFDATSLKFIQVNSSARKNLNYTKEELKELTPLDLKPEFTPESFENHIAPLRSGEKTHIQFDTVHRRKDGSLYDVKIMLQQIQSQNQQVFAAIIEDVSDRRQVEHELKQSEELFSKAFQSNPVPFSISGPEGAIYDLNEAWLSTMGYTREEAIGNSSLKLGVWADPKERERFVELLKENGTVNNFETQYRTKSGVLRDMVVSGEWVQVRGEPRLFNITHDVTESKAAERQLLEDRDTLQELVNEATADLKSKARELEASLAKEKELNELQRQFVSMASHEFRTPLAIIDSTAQRLKKSADRLSSEDVLKRVDKIRDAVVRMTRLMESTLTAARLDEGKVAVDMQSCNIGQVVSEVCLRLQEITRNHIITFELNDLPETIRADDSALDQILTNLLSNAAKYAPDAPDILVKAFGDGNHIVIQVRDHGLGIDEDDLPNMFERFFRAKTSTGIVGTGIGLNLVKTLVEMHGGTVSIDSKKDEGSTFTVRLPVAGPGPSEKAA
jgi:PAS domain S-box-containing protein